MRRLIVGLIALAGCAGGPSPRSPSGGEVTAFVDVAVIPLDRERLLEHQTVLVRDGRIVSIAAIGERAAPPSARIVDGRGRFLLPGLADLHAHLVRPEDLDLYVAYGVTTVRNMWGTPRHLEWRARIARGELLGPTIVTAGPIVDGESPDHDGSLVVRTVDEVAAAIALHRAAGYDFVKVYAGLSAPVYQRLVAAAREAGLPVAGHVPRAVGLAGVVAARQDSVEHLNGFFDALQADDSPLLTRFDREARRRKIDFVDEKKIAPLIESMRAQGVWNCPTRTVLTSRGTVEETRAHLALPEMRYVPASTRATWEPDDRPAEEVARAVRGLALDDRLIRALHDGGARLLVGTDPGNPLVVPGFSVHEELRHLVRVGLTPYQALRAATGDAAEFLHATGEMGTIAVGARADLLLLDGNPLVEIAQTERIAGVMVRGRYLDRPARAALLDRVAATVDGERDAFAGLADPGGGDFRATFEVRWKGAWFGKERFTVAHGAGGGLEIRAQSFDPHQGQRITMRLTAGTDGAGDRVELTSDGAIGRGDLTVTRAGERAQLRGHVLAGPALTGDAPLPSAALLDASGFIASQALIGQRLRALAVGQSIDLDVQEAALGSEGTVRGGKRHVARLTDGEVTFRGAKIPARRYQVDSSGPPTVLFLDEHGWPLRMEQEAFHATALFQRIE